MRHATMGALAALALGCEKSDPPRAPVVVAPVVVARDAGGRRVDAGPPDAGPTERVVLRLRVKNIDRVPLRLLTNPDTNELIHAHRVNVSSDRAAVYAGGARVERVKAFPIGQMPLCTADAGAGYGGLGQPGSITLAPGESFEAARWDGILREEVLDPQRGVCARESAPTPARYRFRLDQPQLEGAPDCIPAVTAWPIPEDAGVPVLEIRCRNAVRDAGVRAAPAPGG
ncbi:MAG: hypothetical protein Q8S73_45445 [Deltaproteobacteria bacterium]|nr:hypothetical protein [Myxococcales bacterium]MDP3221415.1 hypothetical protein [Deltaproteobacteria bacterium]